MKQLFKITLLTLSILQVACSSLTDNEQHYRPAAPQKDGAKEVEVFIRNIQPGSLAQMSGVESNLKVVTINGQALTTIDSIRSIILKEKSMTITVLNDNEEITYLLSRETPEERWGVYFSVLDLEGEPLSFYMTKQLNETQQVEYLVSNDYTLTTTLSKLKNRLLILDISLLNKMTEPLYFDITGIKLTNSYGELLRPITAEEAAFTFLDKDFYPEVPTMNNYKNHKTNTKVVKLSQDKQKGLMKESLHQGYMNTYGTNYVDPHSDEFTEFSLNFNKGFMQLVHDKMTILEPQASESFRAAALKSRLLQTGELLKGTIYFYVDSLNESEINDFHISYLVNNEEMISTFTKD